MNEPNGAAWPSGPYVDGNGVIVNYGTPGMTLRQWAAVEIAKGLVANPTLTGGPSSEYYADAAIDIADAILAAEVATRKEVGSE